MSRGRAGRSQQQLDRVLRAQCHGEAWRRISAGEPLVEVVAAIRELVGDRAHLLVEEAGMVAGSWAARPTALGTELVDVRALHRWVREGWTRAAALNHTAS